MIRVTNNRPLAGKKAIVTGPGSGIGEAIVRVLARDGTDISLIGIKEDKLKRISDELEKKHGVEAIVVPTDVRYENQVKHAIDKTVEEFSKLDILVNNAGLWRGRGIEDISAEDYRLMMETNIDGVFFATREALPHLKKVHGNLIFIGSAGGLYPHPKNAVYGATKWWIRGFAHSVEAIMGEDGVGVTVINPSSVRTEFKSVDGEKVKNQYEKGEATEPQEVAEIVAFVAQQKSHSTISETNILRRRWMSDRDF